MATDWAYRWGLVASVIVIAVVAIALDGRDGTHLVVLTILGAFSVVGAAIGYFVWRHRRGR